MSNETDPRAVAVALLKKMNLCQVDGLGVITPPALIDTDTLILLMEVLVEAGRAKMYTLNVNTYSHAKTNKELSIGDRVVLSPSHKFRVTKTMPAEYNPTGIKGTVEPYTWWETQKDHWVQVRWDNGLTNHYPIDDDCLIKQGD